MMQQSVYIQHIHQDWNHHEIGWVTDFMRIRRIHFEYNSWMIDGVFCSCITIVFCTSSVSWMKKKKEQQYKNWLNPVSKFIWSKHWGSFFSGFKFLKKKPDEIIRGKIIFFYMLWNANKNIFVFFTKTAHWYQRHLMKWEQLLCAFIHILKLKIHLFKFII